MHHILHCLKENCYILSTFFIKTSWDLHGDYENVDDTSKVKMLVIRLAILISTEVCEDTFVVSYSHG